MSFGVSGVSQLRFIQRESLINVDVSVDLSKITIQRDLKMLMQKCLGGDSSEEENQLFGRMWQERVRRLLLEHGEDPDVFKLIHRR